MRPSSSPLISAFLTSSHSSCSPYMIHPSKMLYLSLFFLLSVLLSPSSSTSSSSSSSLPSSTDRFITNAPSNSTEPQEYIDPTVPPPAVPSSPPLCSLHLLHHSFGHTIGLPPATAQYSPPLLPNCSSPWSLIVLHLNFSSSLGNQSDRTAAVWLAGVELLRTNTAQPSPYFPSFWQVRKDVTKYHSLFLRPGTLSMMLENAIGPQFTAVYYCNLSLEFYPQSYIALPTTSSDVALPDLILPISMPTHETGHWFRIRSDSPDAHTSCVAIPSNTYRAILEIYVSFHDSDEFWYSNPPDSYIAENSLTAAAKGNGAFRRVVATVDGRFLGSVIPFPVMYTGGINPLLWAPIVGIGAFDVPSHSLDITPFLGVLLDGKGHEFELNVTNAAPFWLVDANLHLWLDSGSPTVQARLTRHVAPLLSIARYSKFFHLNGTFKINAGSSVHYSGWVNSSLGNLTTEVDHKVKFKNLIVFLRDGHLKEVHLKAKVRTAVTISKEDGVLISNTSHKYRFPLTMMSSYEAAENGTYWVSTNLTHTLYEENLELDDGDNVIGSVILSDKQQAIGWMRVKGRLILSGSGKTVQTYEYQPRTGECTTREVSAKDGKILKDNVDDDCPASP